MGDGIFELNILTNEVWDKLYEIKDFLLLMKIIEHLENLLTTEISIFHLCTIVYTKEDLKKEE